MKDATHITPKHVALFDRLTSGGDGYALFSCFYDGQPAVAIVHVRHEVNSNGGAWCLHPVWLAIDDAIAAKLTDHENIAPQGHTKNE